MHSEAIGIDCPFKPGGMGHDHGVRGATIYSRYRPNKARRARIFTRVSIYAPSDGRRCPNPRAKVFDAHGSYQSQVDLILRHVLSGGTICLSPFFPPGD